MGIDTNYLLQACHRFASQPDIQTQPVGSQTIETFPVPQSDSWAGATQPQGRGEFRMGSDGTLNSSSFRQYPDGTSLGASMTLSPDGSLSRSSYRSNPDGSWERSDVTRRDGQEERNTWCGGPGGRLQSYSCARTGQDGRTDVNLTRFDADGRPTDYSFHRAGKCTHHRPHRHHAPQGLPIRNGWQMEESQPGYEAPPYRG